MQEPRERGCQAPWPIHTQTHFFLGDFPQIREWPRQLPPAAGDLLPLQRCQQLVDHKGSWEVRRGPRMPGQSLPLPGWTRPSGSVLLCVCSSSLEALTPALCSVCSFLHKPSRLLSVSWGLYTVSHAHLHLGPQTLLPPLHAKTRTAPSLLGFMAGGFPLLCGPLYSASRQDPELLDHWGLCPCCLLPPTKGSASTPSWPDYSPHSSVSPTPTHSPFKK